MRSRPLSLFTSETHRVLVVAEIGNNHEGDVALAEDLIGRAADAGADAVKFQTFRTEHYVSPRDAERFARLKGFELTGEQFARLAEKARAAGLLFVSTPFDLDSARLLGRIADAIKIASGDNTFYPLIEEVAATRKPLMVSTGLAGLDEIRFAARLIQRVWRDAGVDQELAVLHCVSAYPTPPEEANLGAVAALSRALPEVVIGYSDHTIGTDAAVLAVAAGARVIEKHFTIDTQYSDFRDHQLSADPATFKTMVARIRETESLMGDGVIGTAPCEAPAETALRRSIAAARDLPAGHVVVPDDITWVRPGGGFAPGQERRVLGRRLRAAVARGDQVGPEVLD